MTFVFTELWMHLLLTVTLLVGKNRMFDLLCTVALTVSCLKIMR